MGEVSVFRVPEHWWIPKLSSDFPAHSLDGTHHFPLSSPPSPPIPHTPPTVSLIISTLITYFKNWGVLVDLQNSKTGSSYACCHPQKQIVLEVFWRGHQWLQGSWVKRIEILMQEYLLGTEPKWLSEEFILLNDEDKAAAVLPTHSAVQALIT